MSYLKVNKITNLADNGAVNFSAGLNLAAGAEIDGTVVANVGFCTAATLSGSGANLTGIAGIGAGIAVVIPFVAGGM
jgi:hypothetical protein